MNFLTFLVLMIKIILIKHIYSKINDYKKDLKRQTVVKIEKKQL